MVMIEAGRFYPSLGTNLYTAMGISLACPHIELGCYTMQFTDNLRSSTEIPIQETNAQPTEVLFKPTYAVQNGLAMQMDMVIERLLPPLYSGNTVMQNLGYCGHVLTDSTGVPSPLLIELGLCLKKYRLGGNVCITLLPQFYRELQQEVITVLPDLGISLHHRVILFDLDGSYEEM